MTHPTPEPAAVPAPVGADGEPAAAPTTEPTVGAGTRGRLLGVVLGVALLVIVLDQATKWWAVTQLRPVVVDTGAAAYSFLGGALRLTYTENTGAAFSLGTGYTWVFTMIAVVVSVVIIRTSRRLGSLGWAIALGGLLGGAVGNLIDRLARAPGAGQGHVVDWIQLPSWPVFNVADMAVVGSAILMVLLTLRGVDYQGGRPGAAA